LCIQDGWIESW